ncbi:nitroreductase family protein [Actinoplanes sp. NPDC049118]|uniref:nitroreductase family protein n=1 Tax=Actinoplanes sp. NPDC049118 TaxID=3155769 RepID=UPI0033D3C365
MTPSTETLGAPARDERLRLLERLLADTRLDAEAAGRPRTPVPAELRRAPEDGPLTPLPPPAAPRAVLDDVLPGRTAVRDYGYAPMSGADLSAILTAADRMDAGGWPAERAAGVDLELYCAAWRVTGVDTGLYRYLPRQSALCRVASLPDGPEAEDLVMQREFAQAAALLVITGNLAAALARNGSHGHRLLLTRAGAAGHAAWLTALRLDLVGTVFAGLLPHVLRERAAADGYHRAALFAFAAGPPQRQ